MYQKKHIAIITLWFPTEKKPSYGVFVENQAAALAEIHDVTVILVTRSMLPFVKKTQRRGFRVLELGAFFLPSKSEAFINFRSRKYLKAFDLVYAHQPVDIIHSHSFMSSFPGQYISKRRTIPHVTTIHDTSILINKHPQWKENYLRSVLSKSNKVIAVGQTLENHLKNRYKLKNTCTIPNGIDTSFFSQKTENWNKNRPFRFLFVGSFDPRKGLLEMINAFNMLEDKSTEFHFVGYASMEKPMKELIAELNLGDRITFYGNLSNQQLPPIYQKCDVYISFSSLETFGVTVVEAMSSGLPVIYSPSGGPENTVAHFCGIRVAPRTVEELHKAMQQIMDEYSTYNPSKIRMHAIEKFNADRVTDMICDLYESLKQPSIPH